MGTNYYWFREKIDTEKQEVDSGLHIGKSSAGWVFNFQAHKDPFQRHDLMSYRDYKEFLKEGFIYNEYEELIPYEKFIKKVESTRPRKYKFSNLPEGATQTRIEGIEEWEDEGFVFTLWDFC